MYSVKTILKEGLPVQIIAVLIGISAGLLMNMNRETFFMLPGILVIIPPFINMGGTITSVLSKRISSALHLGLIQPSMHRTRNLDKNLLSTAIVSIISFFSLGIVASIFNMLLGLESVSIFILPLVTLSAGLILVAVLSLFSVTSSYYSYSRGIDPDNWVIPALTGIGDFLGIFCLMFMLAIVV